MAPSVSSLSNTVTPKKPEGCKWYIGAESRITICIAKSLSVYVSLVCNNALHSSCILCVLTCCYKHSLSLRSQSVGSDVGSGENCFIWHALNSDTSTDFHSEGSQGWRLYQDSWQLCVEYHMPQIIHCK